MPGAPGRTTLTGRHVARKADDAQLPSSGGGHELPEGVRGRFESSLGADLSSVRVHTGPDSVASAQSLGARAYALGDDIHFGAGQYQPDDSAGQHLLAHEVAHTVQQRGGGRRTLFKLEVSEPGDAHEVEADRAADAMVAGAPAQVSDGSGVARKIARKVDLKIARIRFKKEFLPRYGGDKEQAKAAYMKELGGPANWDDAIMEDDAPPQPHGPSIPQPSAEEVDDIIKHGADEGGVVTKAVPADGDARALPAGTYVHKLGAGASEGTISVYAFSGINWKRDMPGDSFQREPGLRYSHDSKTGHNTMDAPKYQESQKPLWGSGGPKPEDALSQGGSGDCYFLSALASVCERKPEVIENAFNPKTPAPSHSITYFKKAKGSDAYAPVTFTVDNFLPTEADGSLTYAKGGNGGIWAPLMEKAWGLYTGSYDSNGGGCSDFSHPGNALEAITGNPSAETARGDGVLDRFRALDEQHKAVTVGIKSDPDAKSKDEPGGPARGATYKEYNLYGAHQYSFVGMSGDAIVLANPWGHADDPVKPLPVSVINEVVDDVSSAAVPGAGSAAYEQMNKDCQERTGSDAVECSTGAG